MLLPKHEHGSHGCLTQQLPQTFAQWRRQNKLVRALGFQQMASHEVADAMPPGRLDQVAVVADEVQGQPDSLDVKWRERSPGARFENREFGMTGNRSRYGSHLCPHLSRGYRIRQIIEDSFADARKNIEAPRIEQSPEQRELRQSIETLKFSLKLLAVHHIEPERLR